MFNEIALTEHDLRRDPGRQTGPHFIKSRFDAARELERVKTGGLVDAEHHSHGSIHAGITTHGLHRIPDFRHITDEQGAVAHGLDHGAGDVLQSCRHAKIAHHDLARTGLQVAARGIARGAAHRLLDLFKRDPKCRQPIGIRLHLDLLHTATDGQHFRHAADALQAAADRPVRQRSQIHRRDFPVAAAQSDEQDFTHQG